jgi:hypothetical protein
MAMKGTCIASIKPSFTYLDLHEVERLCCLGNTH